MRVKGTSHTYKQTGSRFFCFINYSKLVSAFAALFRLYEKHYALCWLHTTTTNFFLFVYIIKHTIDVGKVDDDDRERTEREKNIQKMI